MLNLSACSLQTEQQSLDDSTCVDNMASEYLKPTVKFHVQKKKKKKEKKIFFKVLLFIDNVHCFLF